MEALALDETVTLVLDDQRLRARVDAVFPGRVELALDDAPAFLGRTTSLPARVDTGHIRFAGHARLLPPTFAGEILAEFSHLASDDVVRRWALTL
jgi:hypothetical protein